MNLDLNADLGEAAGADADLMPLITSANVGCGFHAGDAGATRAALELARTHGVAVGRTPVTRTVTTSAGPSRPSTPAGSAPSASTRSGRCSAWPGRSACRSGTSSRTGRCTTRRAANPTSPGRSSRPPCCTGWPWSGCPGSALQSAAVAANVPFIAEGFADRRYRPDGTLVPRSEPDAFVHDPAEAVAQIDRLVRGHGVRTVCVHGDGPDAVAFTTAVRAGLLARGWTVRAIA